ncbi:autotransporter domain-containing protein [Sebaldella termitidis]|uniref:autotransporter domain-containing protein n=1 Tax=Sebaldella termitidis TaxID=826 RepID=UPI003EBD8388
MFKNKKMLMFLALNSLMATFANTKNQVNVKYDRLYNKMIKNFEIGRSNNDSYKVIERILSQKNKELKDLYIQNDYIVKPEFLEWQVLFNTFYSNKNIERQNNKAARYLAEPKSIQLGSSILDIKIKYEIGNYDLSKKGVNIPPFMIPKLNIEVPEIEKVDMNNPFPITVISFSYPLEDVLFADNMSEIGEIETVISGNSYYENTNVLSYNGNNGSTTDPGKDMALFYLDNGKIDNQNTINMEFTLVSSPNNFLGIYSNNSNRYIDFENNGTFTITGEGYFSMPSILTTIGVGFGRGIESRNPDELTSEMFTIDPQKVILSDTSESQGAYFKNFGYAELQKNANWLYFAGKDLDYVSHLPGKNVGNVIVDNNSLGLNFVTEINNDSSIKRRLDPGIMVVRGDSIGIKIQSENEENSIINLNSNSKYSGFSNTTGDRAKDSQIILESRVVSNIIYGGIGIKYDSLEINSTGSNYVNVPIYITGMKNFGISFGTAENIQNLVESDIKVLPSTDGTNSLDPLYQSTIFHSIEHSGTLSAGIVQFGGTVVNKGNITNMLSDAYKIDLNDGTELTYQGNPNGTNSTYGIYKHAGVFTQEGGSIKIGGGNSGAISNSDGEIFLINTNIEANHGAIGLANSTGTITSTDTNFKAGKYSSLFLSTYNSNTGSSGIFDFQGNNTAEVDTLGSAFLVSKIDLFNNFKNLNNLELKLNNGSSLFSFVNIINTVNVKVSDLPSLEDMKLNIVNSGDYNSFRLYYGNFNIDKDTNLDDENNMYKNALLFGVNTFVDTGKTITGTKDGKIGIRAYPFEVFGLTLASTIENDGTIDLSGNASIGTYIDFGTNKNNSSGEIKVTGTNAIGIYGENSSTLINDGNILIGNEGIGIYGTSYQDLTNIQTYGTGIINVTNNGNIDAQIGEGAVGIYINNNKPGGTTADSTLNLGGKIDVSKSENSVGIYVNKGTVNGTGSEITVGKGGVGIYAKDSDINLSNLDLNLYGDNALGIFLEGVTNFTGTGNIDVNGRGVLLYNIASSVTFNNSLTVTSSPDSSYVIGKLDGRTLMYNGITNLDSNGILFLGGNSAVLLNASSVINGIGKDVVGIALIGQGIPDPLWGTTTDGTNRGQINLSDNSMGMYGEQGTRLLNDTTGTISVGKNGAGLYTGGSDSFVINSGHINLGENSHGLYIKDSTNYATNKLTGVIEGTKSGIIGIFVDGGTTMVLNEGNINLIGDETSGIYSRDSGNIINAGEILIGDSSSKSNPGMGIYMTNNAVNNTGKIIVGKNSLGIYNSGGSVIQDGILGIGQDGTGIYISEGTVNLGTNSVLNLNSGSTTGVYGKSGSHIINNGTINSESGNIVFGLENNTSILNNKGIILKEDSVFIYSLNNGIIENSLGADILMSGSNNTGFYTKNGGSILNKGNITGNAGIANIGIYNNQGSIENYGNIKLGDSLIIDKEKPLENIYSVGIYGNENTSLKNYGNIEVGESGIGIFTKNGNVEFLNKGNITSVKNNIIGMYLVNSTLRNEGNITLSGNNSIGIAVTMQSTLTNTGIITINGADNIGILGNIGSKVINLGKIYVNGNDSIGIQLESGATLENSGKIILTGGVTGSKDIANEEAGYLLPSIINAGIIKVDEKFEINDMNLTIKVDPKTVRLPTIEEITMEGYDIEDLNGGFLVSNAVSIKAPSFDFNGNTTKIDPLFTQGTNARVYKFENVFDPTTEEGGQNSGELSIKSGSLTFEAIPNVNSRGKIDIWMKKINYNEFTQGSWQNQFAENIEGKYLNAIGDALKIYDRIDLITEQDELNERFSELAGSIYANMNQREQTIADVFGDSLEILQNSKNNTKENVKVNIIAGKGRIRDKTEGITGYDYTSTGVQLLREAERTYKHTFGYSFGYLHTGFEYIDSGSSEEKSDTIQLGLHNKYNTDSWLLKNDLTGRVSFHDIERNIDWTNSGRSEMTAKYESYSLTSDNIIGKELLLGKGVKIIPYGGIKVVYATRPTFSESGLEALQVKGNDAWSIKPKAGVKLETSIPASNSGWKLKGALDLLYEYELADLNEGEKARLISLEEEYHKLSKPEEEKGVFKTKISIGAEIEDRYGIFLIGEYNLSDNTHSKDDYRAGVTLKAVF